MNTEFKIALIHGNNDMKIETIGNILDSNSLHVACLLEYARKNYQNIPVFEQLSIKHRAETVGYFFTLLNDIVFFNTTKDVIKYGKTGMFLFPNAIDETQREVLYNFTENLEDFSISIFGELKIEEGILEGKEFYATNGQTPIRMLDSYFEKQAKENSRKK